MTPRRFFRFLLALLPVAALACAGGKPADPHALRGSALPQPLAKRDFTLTSTDGRPYDFQKETDGYVTMLFFGYTHCADVCPVQMRNLAAVLQRSPYETASRVKVVFVTTDPDRDTPEVLRAWLDQMDPSFVGLRGSPEAVARVQEQFGLPPAVREDSTADGGYTVGHAAQVLAFTPDNRAHVAYGFGTRQADWAHDLPLLVHGRWAAR